MDHEYFKCICTYKKKVCIFFSLNNIVKLLFTGHLCCCYKSLGGLCGAYVNYPLFYVRAVNILIWVSIRGDSGTTSLRKFYLQTRLSWTLFTTSQLVESPVCRWTKDLPKLLCLCIEALGLKFTSPDSQARTNSLIVTEGSAFPSQHYYVSPQTHTLWFI